MSSYHYTERDFSLAGRGVVDRKGRTGEVVWKRFKVTRGANPSTRLQYNIRWDDVKGFQSDTSTRYEEQVTLLSDSREDSPNSIPALRATDV